MVGFVRSVLEQRTPFARPSTELEGIYNYRNIEGLYATSGQPSEAQFRLIRDAGYEAVINLAPTSKLENSVVHEAEVLAALGLPYIHIPVDFKHPTEADFEAFVQGLRAHEGRKIWVHCAANMRVSAFTYRYRKRVLGEDEAVAAEDLAAIWTPTSVWQAFIAK